MPEDQIGFTFVTGQLVDRVPVKEDPNGIPAFEVNANYFLADGKSLMAPIPAVLVTSNTYNNLDVLLINFGGGPGPDPESRDFIDPSETLAFSAHSLLEQSLTGLNTQWDGEFFLNYIGYSFLMDRWNANGLDRTAAYSGALVVTEFGDFETGLADPASAQGQQTLQALYWYALTAQAKGCKALFIYPPWTPEVSSGTLDMDSLRKVTYWKKWLDDRSDITLEVWVVPVPQVVRQFREYYAPLSIFIDGLHLAIETNHSDYGVGFCLFTTMTGELADTSELPGDYGDLAQIAYDVAYQYDCTGLEGPTVVVPFPVAEDPLPNPLPLP